MSNLFDGAGVAAVDAWEWLVADTSRADFGSSVTEEELDEGVFFRDAGIIGREGDEVFIRRVGTAQKAAWIVQKESSKGDLRLLGNFRDGQNK